MLELFPRSFRVERRPAIFYTHPWEIDPGQPRLDLPKLHALRHYSNLDTTESKLTRLLADFRFAPLSDVLVDDGKLAADVLRAPSRGLSPASRAAHLVL